MAGDKALFGIDEQGGAVKRGAGAFHHPHHQGGASARGQARQRRHFRPWHIDGGGVIAGKGGAAFRQTIAQAGAEIAALGVTAQQRFRHHNQRGAAGSDGGFPGQDAVKGGGSAGRVGAHLQGGNGVRGHGASLKAIALPHKAAISQGIPSCGAIAQMGERSNRTAEVRGSIPLCSTNFPNSLHSGHFAASLASIIRRAALFGINARGWHAQRI